MKAYYFGCSNGQSGHYLHDEKMSSYRMREHLPADLYKRIDTGFCPHLDHSEGAAAITTELYDGAPWTAFGFWDNSIDKRPGSHSTYVMEGLHTWPKALAIAQAIFPGNFARYKFDIRLV